MKYDVIDIVEVGKDEWEVSFESDDNYFAGITFKIKNGNAKRVDEQYFDSDGNPVSLGDTDFEERKLLDDANTAIEMHIEEMEDE